MNLRFLVKGLVSIRSHKKVKFLEFRNNHVETYNKTRMARFTAYIHWSYVDVHCTVLGLEEIGSENFKFG